MLNQHFTSAMAFGQLMSFNVAHFFVFLWCFFMIQIAVEAAELPLFEKSVLSVLYIDDNAVLYFIFLF